MKKIKGTTVNADGYLRIKTRGPLRDKLAHRAFMARQIGRELRKDEEVHHVCMNRQCWPPTDFHLCLVDQVLAPYMYQKRGKKIWNKRRQRDLIQNADRTRETEI